MAKEAQNTTHEGNMIPFPHIDISSPEAARKTLPELENWLWVNFEDIVGTEMQKAAAYARCCIDAMRFPNAHKSEAMKQAAQEAIEKLKVMLADTAMSGR